MNLSISEKQKKSLIGFKIIDDNDFSMIYKGTYMKFLNLQNSQITSARFNKIHSNSFIIGLNKHNQQRIFYIDKYIIFYKPKISNERKFMENLYNNLKITKQ